jgi:hypothetical protein
MCVPVFRGILLVISIRDFQIKQYFVHLFILLMHAINMKIFKDVHMSAFWGYLYYFLCILYASVGVSVVWYVLCAGECIFVVIYCRYIFLVSCLDDRPL